MIPANVWYVMSTEMFVNIATCILHLFLLSLLLADVFFHTVIQDRADAEGLIFLDQRPDGHVVFTSYELAVKCHLHELVKGFLSQELRTYIHYLSKKTQGIKNSFFILTGIYTPVIYD